MDALATPRTIQGPTKRRADAANNGELWNFAGAAEDRGDLSEGDKARIKEFVAKALKAIELARIGECRWYQFACKRERREVEQKNPGQ